MDNFSITTRLTAKEYSKIMMIGLYKKPAFILATIFGLYLLMTAISDHFEIVGYYFGTSYYEIFAGVFILLGPALITVIAIRQFKSNPSFGGEIKYTFGEAGMSVQGSTFKGEFLWTHIIKQKEISHYLILYHSKKMGNFIDKTKLTPEQLLYVKTKVRKK
jgi:hypothetical protein